jgi:hypothetical protein
LLSAWLHRDARSLTVAVKLTVDHADAEAVAAIATIEPLIARLTSCVMAFSMHPDRELREEAFAVNEAAEATHTAPAVVQAYLTKVKGSAKSDADLTAAASRFRVELERSKKTRLWPTSRSA